MSSEHSAPRVCVVIPCLNEGHTIAAVVRGFTTSLPGAKVLVLDNGSTDATGDEARAAGAEVLVLPEPGKGSAVRAAIAHIGVESTLLLIDGDGTYDPADAPALMGAASQAGKAVMVCGERFSCAGEAAFLPYRRAGNRIITALINMLLGTDCGDALSGYRVLSSEFLSQISVNSRGFELEAELLAEARRVGAQVIEIPVSYTARHSQARSKLVPVADALRILRTTYRLRPRLQDRLGIELGGNKQ